MNSPAGAADLAVLQAVRLKGRVSRAALAETLAQDQDVIVGVVDRLTEVGLLTGGNALRLTDGGRTRLLELLAAERRNIDQTEIRTLHNAFRDVNADFKAAVTDWQIKAGRANTHDDADYDRAVLARVEAVHERATPILAAAVAQLPRLSGYTDKLRHALDRVQAGDTSWLTRPLVDSYHTVWFELHDELIGAAGLTRGVEAETGHAQ